jgi:radical SAM superfamily enzyme YgiQ (UPF0313 family)
MSKVKVVILSVPFTVPVPMLAPALLSGCLNNSGISSVGLDFSFSFYSEFRRRPWWGKLSARLSLGRHLCDNMPVNINVKILRHLIGYLKSIKEQYDPEWIGLSIFTGQSMTFSFSMIKMIRKYLPDTKIVLGGGAMNLPDLRGQFKDIVELIIVGDAEVSFIEAIKQSSRGIIFSPQQTNQDLDNAVPPDWSGYNLAAYNMGSGTYLPITASKGCVRKCTFCDVHAYWPKYIYRDGAKVADTIIDNYQKTGITNFRFTDNLINGSLSHFRKMNERLSEIIPRTIKYNAQAIIRSSTSSPESDFELAASAGCDQLFIGVESGSEKVRNDMKKKFSNCDIEHSALLYHRHKIRQVWMFIVGYPTETEEDFQETLNLLIQYKTLAKDNLIISVTPPFMLLENSPLATNHELEYYGLSKDTTLPEAHWFWESSVNPENTFPERASRWRRFYKTVTDNRYSWSKGMDLPGILTQLTEYEKMYKVGVRKFIPILKS